MIRDMNENKISLISVLCGFLRSPKSCMGRASPRRQKIVLIISSTGPSSGRRLNLPAPEKA